MKRFIVTLAAVGLQLVQNLVFLGFGQLGVEVLCVLAGLHDAGLLVLGQLVPGVIGDDHLNGAQGVAIQNQVVGNLGEGVGLVVGEFACTAYR